MAGSSNLTCGGLFTNIELCIEAEFALPEEAEEAQQALNWMSAMRDASLSHVEKVDSAKLVEIQKLLPKEAFVVSSIATGNSQDSAATTLFGAGSFPAAPPLPSSGATPRCRRFCFARPILYRSGHLSHVAEGPCAFQSSCGIGPLHAALCP